MTLPDVVRRSFDLREDIRDDLYAAISALSRASRHAKRNVEWTPLVEGHSKIFSQTSLR